MKIKFHWEIVTIPLTLLLSTSLGAQVWKQQIKQYNEYVKNQQQEFDKYISRKEKQYNEFVEKQDREFESYLANSWKQFKLFKAKSPYNKPKPRQMPKWDAPKAIKHGKAKIKASLKTKHKLTMIDSYRYFLPETEGKVIYLEEKIDFYGAVLNIKYDRNFIKPVINRVDENGVSKYWAQMCKTDYNRFILLMKEYKRKMRLNDWGYYLLLKKTANALFTHNENITTLFTWFMLNKSGFVARAGYINNRVYLLLPSLNTIYGINYFVVNNMRYYVFPSTTKNIKTYRKDYACAGKIIDLEIKNPLNLGGKPHSRKLTFTYNGKSHNFELKYNINTIKFFENYPLTDLKVYFNAPVSQTTKESLHVNLLPLIRKKTEAEAVNILLGFVQNAFKYKTDRQQLNREKFFFPEETLRYPYSDCEDRAVLFALLVQQLLKLDVMGLKYNGHIAAAVNFNENIPGKYFIFNGKRYTVCDPTYRNAPAGVVMPQYKSAKPFVIKPDNDKYKLKIKKTLWKSIMASGGYPGSNNQNIVFDDEENACVTGYFRGEARFGPLQLKSHDNDVFIAKFNKSGKAIWAKKAGGTGNHISYNISLDENGNCYITGCYDSAMTFNQGAVTLSSGFPGIFIAKYDKNGNFLWATNAGNRKQQAGVFFSYISKINHEGKREWTKLFRDDKKKVRRKIIIDKQGNCYVSGNP